MLASLAFLLLLRAPASIEQIDALARVRDVAGVEKFASAALQGKQAFAFLKRNGVYDSGRFGWTAVELRDVVGGETYVVFSTKLTSEDIGEQVFRWRNGTLGEVLSETDARGIRLVRHELDVRFNLPAKKTMIVDKVAFKREGTPGKSFFVRMMPWYKVSGVSDGAGKTVAFRQAGGVVSIPVAATPEFTYTLRYEAVVDLPSYAGSISEKEVMLTNDYWYPMIARQAAPYTLAVHHPSSWIAVGQGERVGIEEAANEKVTRWRMDLPIVYYSLSVAPFREVSQMIGGRRFTIWSLTMDPDDMKVQTELFAPVIAFYDKTFGAFPFSGYGAVVSDVYGGGALEAYSFATYGTGWLPDEDAHEPAHTWWGGIIPNGYLGSLWNESFAVFSEGLYGREGGEGDRDEHRKAFIQDPSPSSAYNAATCAEGGAAVGPAANGLGYGKGAYVLQMLEQELGTDTMQRTLHEWIASHPKPQLAEWADYEKVVARVSGKDYGWFFDQWVRRTGWADFDIANVRWDGSAVVGDAAFKGQGYRLTLEVMAEYAGGAREFRQVQVPAAGGLIRVAFSKKPTLVSFDPWRRVLRRFGSDERPVQLSNALGIRRYRDPAHPDWLTQVGGRRAGPGLKELPAELDGVLVIGSPETLPAMRPLCEKAGFVVGGDTLTWRGTSVDLRRGGAMAVVDLGEGKRCTIALGNMRLAPNPGRARIALFDRLGRFVRGETDPKTSGMLTVRL